MQRVVVWQGIEEWRAEVAEIELVSDGLRARGTQIGVDPAPYRVSYSLDATGRGFVTRALQLEVTGEGWRRRLRLERDPVRGWTAEADGEGEPDLPPPGGDEPTFSDALDCDLAFSPLTNAMPIRRHALHERPGSETLLMAWVSVPDLAVGPSRQHYTHVARRDDGATVRYESESRDFVAELELDPDGIVRVYPQLARRVAPGERASA